MVTELTNGYFKLYRMYQKGILFRTGGVADQPAKYLHVMNLLDNSLAVDYGKE